MHKGYGLVITSSTGGRGLQIFRLCSLTLLSFCYKPPVCWSVTAAPLSSKLQHAVFLHLPAYKCDFVHLLRIYFARSVLYPMDLNLLLLGEFTRLRPCPQYCH